MNVFVLKDDQSYLHVEVFNSAYKKAMDALSTYGFDVLFIDNDLGKNVGEGLDVATFLYNNEINHNTTIIVHSGICLR